jgi:hypothetical protein
MNQWKKHMATRVVPEDVTLDLQFWLQTLSTFEPTRLILSSQPTEVRWVGDASTSFGIGILIGHRWSQFQVKESWDLGTPARGIAWLETIAICLGLLMLIDIGIPIKGENYIVWTDNTVTEAVLRTKKLRDPFVNEEWKIIQSILMLHHLDLTPQRVVSAENVADGLSRGIQAPHIRETRVWFEIPDDLVPFIFQA